MAHWLRVLVGIWLIHGAVELLIKGEWTFLLVACLMVYVLALLAVLTKK